MTICQLELPIVLETMYLSFPVDNSLASRYAMVVAFLSYTVMFFWNVLSRGNLQKSDDTKSLEAMFLRESNKFFKHQVLFQTLSWSLPHCETSQKSRVPLEGTHLLKMCL